LRVALANIANRGTIGALYHKVGDRGGANTSSRGNGIHRKERIATGASPGALVSRGIANAIRGYGTGRERASGCKDRA